MRIKHWFYTVPLRLRSLFRRRQVEQELDEELHYHLDRQIEENIAKGMTPEEAHHAALRAMGGVERRKEECRDMRRLRWVEDLMQDVRYSQRMLRKNPGFTAVAVITLALGIGANTAIFSASDALLWRGLPATNHARLFTVTSGDGGGFAFSYPDYVDFRDRNQVLEGLTLYNGMALAFGAGERSEMVMGECVTGNFFDVLGVPMAQGRAFAPEEDLTQGAHPVVVVSYDFWRRRFGGDPQLIGKPVTFNNQSFTVIGIAAAGFVGASVPIKTEVWLPMMMRGMGRPGGAPELNDRRGGGRGVYLRDPNGHVIELGAVG